MIGETLDSWIGISRGINGPERVTAMSHAFGAVCLYMDEYEARLREEGFDGDADELRDRLIAAFRSAATYAKADVK